MENHILRIGETYNRIILNHLTNTAIIMQMILDSQFKDELDDKSHNEHKDGAVAPDQTI